MPRWVFGSRIDRKRPSLHDTLRSDDFDCDSRFSIETYTKDTLYLISHFTQINHAQDRSFNWQLVAAARSRRSAVAICMLVDNGASTNVPSRESVPAAFVFGRLDI